MAPIDSGPLAGCNIDQNGNCADPNLQPGRSTGNNTFITISKEIHTLNDAILAAAKSFPHVPRSGGASSTPPPAAICTPRAA